MRFLSVADRELRSAARRKGTYHTRWITAAAFLGLLVWLLWAFNGFTNMRVVPQVFAVISVLTFIYCLALGTACTADCISSERREGTLGLLFLTNLNSAEIIAGKLCSTALASVYGLMAIFPVLALPLLMGGITFGHFARTVLGLLVGILFALATGFLISVLCKRQFVAIAMAMGLTLGWAGGLMLGAAGATNFTSTKPLANWLAPLSPLYTVLAADGGLFFGQNQFWHSVAVVAGMSLACLGVTMLLLARTWRDRPKSPRAWRRFGLGQRSERSSSPKQAALRRRLLAINPLFWLAARQRVSSPVFMVIAVVLTSLTVYVAAPFFDRVMRVGTASPVFGHLFSWLWAGLAIHALVLYYAGMTASHRLAEDKQTGALELILSTPVTEQTISRGLWLAFGRRMFFPALLAVLVHLFFIWICMVMTTLEPPGDIPAGTTPSEILWSVLLDRPIRGQLLDWHFGFMIRAVLLILLLLVVTWPTLGWVGRWLGLRMKHPGFAPMASLVILTVPPVLLFSLTCYLADRFNLDRLPERQFLPMMMWLAFIIGVGHCAALSFLAASRLRNDLRSIALSRYQPLPVWRLRLPSRRSIVRFAVAVTVFAFAIVTLVAGYYRYQNWRSSRAWSDFQAGLKQKGESLDLAPLLPPAAPDHLNFARSPAFRSLLTRTNRELAGMFEGINLSDGVSSYLTDWPRQTHSSLQPFLGGVPVGTSRSRAGWQTGGGSETNRQAEAKALLLRMQSHQDILQAVAAAALEKPFFGLSTNRNFQAVLQPLREETVALERLHMLFQMRACAALALGENTIAAEDVLTGLRLVHLARQNPDTRSMERVQRLLARSLQPMWEGLGQRAWTEPQLAAMQRELAGLNLLADYTNAVHRVVLAYIETWSAQSTAAPDSLPASVVYITEPAWRWQPRGWWFECCIQLHHAGRETSEKVDLASGRIQSASNWSDLSGLPVDPASRELLQQSWWGANPSSVAFAQTALNQALVACALERYRLANAAYPDSLESLLPALLDRVPHDAVSGPAAHLPIARW